MRKLSSLLFSTMPPCLRQLTSPPTSHTRRFLFSKAIAVEKSYHHSNILNFPFRDNSISTSLMNKHFFRFSTRSTTKEPVNQNGLEVEIISKEFIKPSIPTPQHLRMHKLSLFDQLFPYVYVPFVYFYSNDNQDDNKHSTLERRQILKQSLSKTLAKFYPLAGRFNKDRQHINCNDDGVYYVEAKVNHHLSDFLKQPDNKSMYGLLPFHPNIVQSLSEKHLVMVQVTEFGCGGIAIGMYTDHKFIDAYSLATFLKAWSTMARAPLEEISPSFISSSIHPPNPAMSKEATLLVVPLFAKSKTATRRFLFPASSLGTLKEKLNASRFLTVTGLIWKRAIATSKATSKAAKCAPKSCSLTIPLNVRDRASPPFPPYSMGNIFTITPPIKCSGDEDLGLDKIVQQIKDSISQFNIEYLVKVGGYWLSNPEATLMMLHMPYADKNAKHMIITSHLRSGTYDTDFGWGKPIWISLGNGDSNFPMTENFVILMDSRCGNGVEAWVTLSEEDMNAFEKDPELLAFASLNPSPYECVE